MADDRKARDRALHRSTECHRLEEQLWSLAYEQVLPVIHRTPKTSGAQNNQHHYQQSRTISKMARRA
jgi:hypothetical protein